MSEEIDVHNTHYTGVTLQLCQQSPMCVMMILETVRAAYYRKKARELASMRRKVSADSTAQA